MGEPSSSSDLVKAEIVETRREMSGVRDSLLEIVKDAGLTRGKVDTLVKSLGDVSRRLDMIEKMRRRTLWDWVRDGVSVVMLAGMLVGIGKLLERDSEKTDALKCQGEKIDQLIAAHNDMAVELARIGVMVEQHVSGTFTARRAAAGGSLGGGAPAPAAKALRFSVTPRLTTKVK